MRWGRGLVLAVAALLLLAGSTVGAPTPTRVHFTAAGDYGATASATSVLNALAAGGSDAHLALGDMSYGTTGAEQAWCDFVKARVGEKFPFEMLAGNHESNGLNGNINDFSACLPNQLPGVVGTYGRQYYVDVPQVDPLVRFVMVSPSLDFPGGVWSYPAGSARYNWTANAIDTARAANIPWVVVGMHKPCISTGVYSCDPGADLINLMLSKKVDLVLNGHEHMYQRSKQLALGTGCTTLTIGTYNASCVADADSNLVKGAGTVFATIGTGGTGLRDVNLTDPESGYFVSASGANQNPTYGFGDFELTPDTMTMKFVRGTGGTFTDGFTITKDTTPNTTPTAAFTSTTSGLTTDFDAAGSADPDGSITTYAWDFGDNGSGSGVNPSHTYALPGTYSVTLTVTDDDGARDTVTHPVTATAPPGGGAVLDTFTRSVVNGWGAANVGGGWTTTGPAARFAVSGGRGTITLASAGLGPWAYLNAVSQRDVDAVFDVSTNVAATGSGIVHSLAVRRVGTTDYRVGVRLLADRSVQLSISRVVGGAETKLGTVTVPGLVYAAGDDLRVRFRVSGASPTTLAAKVWKVADPEPAATHLSRTDGTAGLQGPGSVGVQTYVHSNVTTLPVVAAFDNLNIG